MLIVLWFFSIVAQQCPQKKEFHSFRLTPPILAGDFLLSRVSFSMALLNIPSSANIFSLFISVTMAAIPQEDRELHININGAPMWDFQDSTPGGVLIGDSSEIGALLDRPTSAPPALEVSRDPFFTAPGSSGLLDLSDQLRYGIGDVRLIPNYDKFYEQRRDPSLPPPLERSPFASSPLFPEPSTQVRFA